MGKEFHIQNPAVATKALPGEVLFAWGTTFVFAAISIFLASRHQWWIDESFYYLLARDSSSWEELMTNRNAQPQLWSVLLYFTKFLTPDTVAVQLLHGTLASATVFLVARYCILSRLIRLLFVFGYFMLFEYNVIAKNYAGGIFLIFLAIVLFLRNRNILGVSLCLGLAGNFHLFSFFVAAFLFIYFLRTPRRLDGRSILAVLIFCGLGVLALVSMLGASESFSDYDEYNDAAWLSLERLSRSLAAPARGLLNIPDFRAASFWNSNIIFSFSSKVGYCLSIFLIVALAYWWWPKKNLLMLFFGPLLLIMAFVYVAPLGTGVRYWGFFYLMFFICAWLWSVGSPLPTGLSYLLKGVLLLQVIVCIPTVWEVINRPFSGSKSAASSIRSKGLQNLVLFTHKLAVGPSLSVYTGKPIFYPGDNKFASFSYDIRSNTMTHMEFLHKSREGMVRLSLDSCLLITNKPFGHEVLAGTRFLSSVSCHPGALVTSEDYFVYLLKKN